MASPAAENMQNGISTPPATMNAPTLSPPTQPPQPPSQSQPNGTTPNNPPTAVNMNVPFAPTSLQDQGVSKRPRDARLIHLILANMGVHAYTERVPLQLLDFAYRYTSSILSDAISYEPPAPTTSSSKKRGGGGGGGGGGGAGGNAEDGAGNAEGGVSLNALRTAVGARAANTFSGVGVLGKEFMSEVASERNRIALPRVEREFGLRLPPERYCFTGVGWGVRGTWEEVVEADEEDEDMELDPGESAGFGGPVGGVNGDGGADTAMGGMGEEDEDEMDEELFEDAMGVAPQNSG
ncbi:TFIID-31kDa-domain-containing protein [Clathrospora elynae]|uniref:TFIID-31kDa-domain-containing protein n=1 Tax=Clathrospora elynae TaxID=706981 RepID=A0A6A5SYG9_9PLEO|nr:TFIID-31kDa-domain-containing protein [Clathrospora elynae]